MDEKMLQFLPYFPDISETNFTYNLSRKKEFYDLKSKQTERPFNLKQGSLLNHQLIIKRFVNKATPYAELLLYHGMGTGKTCAAIGVAENFKEFTETNPLRKTLIIVKNQTFVNNFEQEIAHVCTATGYIPFLTEEEKLQPRKIQPLMKTRRRKLINEYYQIETLDSFVSQIKNHSSAYIKKVYSNRLIIIDEVHHLRVQALATKKKNKQSRYNIMFNFLHTVENCRMLLLSGTPMWDNAFEIATIMNLVLPMNEQLPNTVSEFNNTFLVPPVNPRNIKRLVDTFRGRISYLRATTEDIKKQEMGISKPYTKKIIVYPSELSDFQYKHYKKASEQESKTKGKFSIDERNALNFVFPDGSYGMRGFKKYFQISEGKGLTQKTTKKITFKDNSDKKDIRKNLAKYSTKYNTIIQNIINNPKELTFVYSELVTGSGAILFAKVLELFGYRRASGPLNLDRTLPAKRYAIVTTDLSTTASDAVILPLLRTINDPRNKEGDFIQVLIGSEKISEGISLKNFRNVHILTPHWNLSSMDQAAARVTRFRSHVAFQDPNDRYVKIYRHIAVPPVSSDVFVTTDVRIYRLGETKDLKSAQIRRLIKQIAIDCALNYQKNVLPNDLDQSRDCDYRNCNYVCDSFSDKGVIDRKNRRVWTYDIPENQILDNTYDRLYNKDLTSLKLQIIHLFERYFSLSLFSIQQIFSKEPLNFILEALQEIIQNNTLIKDRYGFLCYLKEQSDIYFLDSSLDNVSDYQTSIYTATKYITNYVNLEEINTLNSLTKDNISLDKCSAKSFDLIFAQTSYKSQVVLFEALVSFLQKNKNISPEQKEIKDIIYKKFKNALYSTPSGINFHILYETTPTDIYHSVSAKNIKLSGKMRVYEPIPDRWRNVLNREEEEKYATFLKQEKKEEEKKQLDWEKNPYGIFGKEFKKDGKFRLIRKPNKPTAKTRGMVCKSMKRKDLTEIILSFNVLDDEKYLKSENKGVGKKTMIDLVELKLPENSVHLSKISSFPTEKLIRVYDLTQRDRTFICKMIWQIMKDKNLLLKE